MEIENPWRPVRWRDRDAEGWQSWEMENTYQATPPKLENHQFIPGLHVAIVTNPKKGAGGSLFALEVYNSSRLSGLPAILATFDEKRRYPDIGTDLRRLPVPNGDTGGQSGIENLACLLPIIREAEAEHKLLILDTVSGFSVRDPIFEVLEYCGIHQAASVAALIAVRQDIPGFYDGALGCRAFQSIGISFTRALVRAWGRPIHCASLGLLDIPRIDSWTPRILSPRALALIQNGQLPVRQHADLFPEVAGSCRNVRAIKPSSELRLHVSSATRAIYTSVLAPICPPLPR